MDTVGMVQDVSATAPAATIPALPALPPLPPLPHLPALPEVVFDLPLHTGSTSWAEVFEHLRCGYPLDSHFADGTEHNGACTMTISDEPSRQLFIKATGTSGSGSATDAKLCLGATRLPAAELGRSTVFGASIGKSIPIIYKSAAVHAKQMITISERWPRWDIDARLCFSPRAPGVWPALWLSGVGESWPPEVDMFEFKCEGPETGGEIWFNTMQGECWKDPDRYDDVIRRKATEAMEDYAAPPSYGCRLELIPRTADVRVTYFYEGREVGAHVGIGYKDMPMVLIANLQMHDHAEVEEAWFELHALRVRRWAGDREPRL